MMTTKLLALILVSVSTILGPRYGDTRAAQPIFTSEQSEDQGEPCIVYSETADEEDDKDGFVVEQLAVYSTIDEDKSSLILFRSSTNASPHHSTLGHRCPVPRSPPSSILLPPDTRVCGAIG